MAATQFFSVQDFLLAALLIVAAVAPVPSSGLDDDRGQRPECVMWSKLENKTLPLQDQGHANCSTNDDCTGFDCVGIYQGKGLSFGMRVLPCLATPGVEIYGYAPQFNTKNFSHVFKHKSEYTVPGALLNLSLIPGAAESAGQEVGGKLEVHIQRNPGGKSLMMGLVLKACINDNCLLSKPVFNHTEIPVPECTNHVDSTKVNTVCSMNAMDACGPNQSCVQEEANSNVGLCECLSGFVKQDDGTCLSKTDDERLSRNSQSAPVKPSHSPQPQISEGSSGAAVAAGVVSVLVVLAILGAGAFIIFRTRLAPRLRARLTNTPYEDIVIGKRSESRQNVIA